ncbi:hypothetical protein CRYUN_Cryun29cG0026700 [Craigia yunnanensis]
MAHHHHHPKIPSKPISPLSSNPPKPSSNFAKSTPKSSVATSLPIATLPPYLSPPLLPLNPSYALSVFNHFHHKSIFLFNALVRGLMENSHFQSSISHFLLMLSHRVRLDKLTYPFVLKFVEALGLRCLGLILHGRIIKSRIEFDSFVRISLVEMYVKLEELSFAFQVFDESPEGNKSGSILLWSVLINGYCKIGNLGKLWSFSRLCLRGIMGLGIV